MSSRRSGEWLIGLLSLAIVTAVHASPTASTLHNDVLNSSAHPSKHADAPLAPTCQVTEIENGYNATLARIADELLRPPADSPLSAASSLPAGTTSLPPIPGALFMTLAGFLCVSLVRDRKVWTAALVGLLWAGQVGVTALPQLARHLAGRRHTEQLYSLNLTGNLEPDDLDRLRSDIEGTHYIGLLHYLAGIPNNRMSFLRKQESRFTTHVGTPHFALTEACAHIVLATKRLVCITKWHAYFSPAFIFENLARGPPLPACKRSLTR
jgi:hypothetical protein